MPKIKEQSDKPVLYPDVRVNGGNVIPPEALRLSAAKMRELLGWEDEENYAVRITADGKTKKAQATFGEDYLLKDEEGKKVRCWRNTGNRPFDETHARRLAQDVLGGNWRFNGEAIIIGKYGSVESGQHRGAALVLASQIWAKNPDQWPRWKEEPFIESLIVAGVSEAPDVLRTLDNVKPRSESDVIYTSEIFAKLSSADRKECSRMLAAAIDLLWKRTGAAGISEFEKYKTNSMALEFRERHPKLTTAVKHLFEENSERAISVLRLSAGAVAALMYLMGTSSSDCDVYHNAAPPSEKVLSFDNWEKAEEFVVELAKGDKLASVRKALKGLIDADGGLGGRVNEKMAVVAKAWNLYAAGRAIEADDLALEYYQDAKGNTRLADDPTHQVGGIDLGQEAEAPDESEEAPTEEEVATRKAEIRKAQADKLLAMKGVKRLEATAEEVDAAIKGGKKPSPKTLPEQIEELKESSGGKVLFFKRPKGFAAWGDDALLLSQKFGKELLHLNGLKHVGVKDKEAPALAAKLKARGSPVAVCVPGERGVVKEVIDAEDYFDAAEAVETVAKTAAKKPVPKAKSAAK